ncbi:hypothetical protein [Candidatus Poriferisocius sp.]|uniref:hypothetical protein n=1 Tax=Candidatus Poriferisocius sp. TaxID=3101276 RepID=UPI003B0228AE
MTLVAYLGHVTDKLVVDLATVSSYAVDGTSVVVPQRVTPERHEMTVKKSRSQETGILHPGSEKFEATISQSSSEDQAPLRQLLQWARDLEKQGLVNLATYEGKGSKRFTLLPRLKTENAGLVTIWNDGGTSLQFWRTVFKKKAPDFIEQIENLAETRIGQGNTTRNISDELLAALTEAYAAAAK